METEFVISTGGTGGHIFPALSVAEALAERGREVLILLGGPKFEAELPFRAVRIKSGHLHGLSLKTAGALLSLSGGILEALSILRREKKERKIRLIATGSYATLPVLIAANLLSVRYYLLEQNLLPGTVTTLFAGRARAVFGTFEETRDYLKGARYIRTGNPIRKGVRNRVDRALARRVLGLSEEGQLVLVIGGSLGAKSLAKMALWATEFLPEIFFLIQTGTRNFEEVRAIKGERGENFRLMPHIERMDLAYSSADIAVSRAGGGAIAELAYHGVPSILVPFPGARRNHQYLNARAIHEAGGALVLEENELTPESLAVALRKLLDNPQKLEMMRKALKNFAAPEAALKIIEMAEVL